MAARFGEPVTAALPNDKVIGTHTPEVASFVIWVMSSSSFQLYHAEEKLSEEA